MRIKKEKLEEIKSKADIVSVIANHVTLQKKGSKFVGLCPFHTEKTPSFTVFPESNTFYCFGCTAGGDAFDFIKKIKNISFWEAAFVLAKQCGIELSDENSGFESKTNQIIYEINYKAARFYHKYLLSDKGKKALDYLLSRGVSEPTITELNLGAAPDNGDALLHYLLKCGFSIRDILKTNIIVKTEKGYYDRYRNRVIFPIFDNSGMISGFVGRTFSDDHSMPKYINSSNHSGFSKSKNLYGIEHAKKFGNESIILVEGPMDVISLYGFGIKNAVASLGTSLTEDQAKLISRYTEKIIIAYDTDEAGKKATIRAADLLKKTKKEVCIATIPECKDPDEYIKKHGKESFERLLNNAFRTIEYKLAGIAKETDLSVDSEKLSYLKAAAKIISESDDALEREIYINSVADMFHISKESFADAVQQLLKKINENKIPDFVGYAAQSMER